MIIYFQDELQICDKTFHKTKEGYLQLEGIISRSGDQDYIGLELGLDHLNTITVNRPVDVVTDTMSVTSFINRPITDDHPNNGVVNATNIRDLGRGMVLDASVTDSSNNVKATMLVMDAELIKKIEDGKRELSAGYSADLIFSDDGKRATQSNIRGNHIAFVDQARCGRECRILDHKTKLKDKLNSEGNNMAKMTINGIELEINDSAAPSVKMVVDSNEKLTSDLLDANKSVDTLQAKLDASIDEVKDLKSKVVTDADIAKKANVIVALQKDVSLVDKDFNFAEKSTEVVRREVVSKMVKDSDFKDKSDAYIEARFDAIIDSAKTAKKDPLTGEFKNADFSDDVTDLVAKARQNKIDRDQKRSQPSK